MKHWMENPATESTTHSAYRDMSAISKQAMLKHITNCKALREFTLVRRHLVNVLAPAHQIILINLSSYQAVPFIYFHEDKFTTY